MFDINDYKWGTHNVNHENNFRIRCFKCGDYDTYIEYDQGYITIRCDICGNEEEVVFNFDEEEEE